MNTDVTYAVALLQARRDRLSDFWRIEQAEEALDILLSKPGRAGEPWQLVRNALVDAGKKLKRRSPLFAAYSAYRRLEAEEGNGTEDLLDVADVMERKLGPADQTMLRLVVGGADAAEIAKELGTPISRARERLSRTRTRARAAWVKEAA